MPPSLRVGLIGFGTIGQQVAEGIACGRAGEVDLVAILTRRPRDAATRNARMLTDLAPFLATWPQMVVEAASAVAVAAYAEPILECGSSLILASTAALADEALRTRLEGVCARSGAR